MMTGDDNTTHQIYVSWFQQLYSQHPSHYQVLYEASLPLYTAPVLVYYLSPPPVVMVITLLP